MKPDQCCEGDYNPWRKEPICIHCNDIRRVATKETARLDEVVACPYCGDPEKYEQLRRERYLIVNLPPEIHERDLTDEETVIFKELRKSGTHAADCLRWIEGERYDPSKDEKFLPEARKAFREWRLLSERKG